MSTPRFRGGEGDWVCPEPECGNLNFARRNSCNRCGKEKLLESSKKKHIGVEIGKVAADKSRGLFSAEDWECSKCGNVNWARRSACNMCNAPKIGDVEERTGYGGGYNDRGVVEYVDRREDSDDEYDEFGRKKKRFRKSNSEDESKDEDEAAPSSTVTVTPTEKEKEADEDGDEEEEDEEEDDDDDDDEDGDLSKYDLSDWGDEKAVPDTEPSSEATKLK